MVTVVTTISSRCVASQLADITSTRYFLEMFVDGFLRKGNSNVRNNFLAEFEAKRVVRISRMDPFIMCTFRSYSTYGSWPPFLRI